jgi:hypothetical protein
MQTWIYKEYSFKKNLISAQKVGDLNKYPGNTDVNSIEMSSSFHGIFAYKRDKYLLVLYAIVKISVLSFVKLIF